MPPPEMQTRSLIVSLHDVSPLTMAVSGTILGDLASAGVAAVSLLIIPDHHHKAPVVKDARFSAWAREQAAVRGHEAVLHGYHHVRPPRPEDGLMARAITGSYTAGEGEFFDISYDAANDLLTRGRSELASCGLSPVGFIAPAWLLGKEATRAVFDAGFLYTTRIDRIEPADRPPVSTQSLVWSVRAGWRRACSLAWNAFLFRRLASHPVLRIGIHPPDWHHPAIRRQILEVCRRALADRRPMTYESWVNCTARRP